MKINRVAIIGAGTMGNGIAHVFAQSGYKTFLCDTNVEILNGAMQKISNNLDRQIKKGMLSDDEKSDIIQNIITIDKIESIPTNIDLAIEAIPEVKLLKINLFKELDKRINPECVFASNTSSISITELAATNRAEKFIGMHFMNPVPVMKLVEIIKGHKTTQLTTDTIKKVCELLNRVPIEVEDYPGFISNRILMPMINEAIFALYEHVASAEDIDKIMKLGMSHPMGPLELADFIGLDVCLNIMNILTEGFNDSKYRPCPLLRKMVAAGLLGEKSGKGFYDYSVNYT